LPLVLEDGRTCGLDVMRIIDGGCAPETDRRRKLRVALALTVYLFRGPDTEPIEGVTKNINTEGFYCHARKPVTVGESIRVVLMIPCFDPAHRDNCMSLECYAHVLRVEPLDRGVYGFACQITDYRVLPNQKITV
jgi:hypothetical protein